MTNLYRTFDKPVGFSETNIDRIRAGSSADNSIVAAELRMLDGRRIYIWVGATKVVLELENGQEIFRGEV
jgi:hypothetical protein